MKNIYQERIMDHYRSTHNRGTIAAPTFSSGRYNPSCGDAIAYQGIITNGGLDRVLFEGKGCVLSQAASSMLADYVRGMRIEQILALDAEAMKKLVGIELGPTRLRCILLSLEALQEGIKLYAPRQSNRMNSSKGN